MGYTVFARKYRPQRFGDLVGQEHVTRTLANAIRSERVAHAFLFTGVRGVGKTSSARLLAKALNCETGPTPEPCNTCGPCTEITQGVDLDVLEMDGASNNSVEDVRRLQESIPYRPSRDRYKVVIVDEVHMLSTGAFNAFLKTLEEPPAHVKFIFATTEAHKVPVTIRSRCQRYDFRLIPQAVIAERVRQILGEEGIDADADAVALVAREASGSMRDALTLLDQVVAFSDGSLRGREVAEQLGIADHSHVRALSAATLSGDAAAALDVIDEVATQGIDLLHFTRQWLDFVRDLVVLRVAGDRPRLVDLTDEARDEAQKLAGQTEPVELQRAFASLSQLVEDVGRASAPRPVLEMGAVRIATRPKLMPMAEVMARLRALEQGSPTPRRREPGPPRSGPENGGREPSGPASFAPASPDRTPQREERAQRAPTPATRPEFAPPEDLAPHPGDAAPASTPRPEAHAPRAAAPSAASTNGSATGAPPARSAAPSAPPARTASASAWHALIAHMRDDSPMWAAMYEHAVASQVERDKLVLNFPEGSFFGTQAQTPQARSALSAACKAVLGREPEVVFQLGKGVQGQTFAQQEAAAVDERKEEIKRRARNHPRVRQALEVFPELGRKVDIQIDD